MHDPERSAVECSTAWRANNVSTVIYAEEKSFICCLVFSVTYIGCALISRIVSLFKVTMTVWCEKINQTIGSCQSNGDSDVPEEVIWTGLGINVDNRHGVVLLMGMVSWR